MHRIGLLLGVLSSTLTVTSCAPPAPLQKRWEVRTDPAPKVEYPRPTLWVGPFATDASSLSAKDLGDHAAAAYIEEMAKLSKGDADSLRANIAKSISSSRPMIDNTNLNRTLLITVGKADFYPADRLARTALTLTPIGFSFADLTAAATAYSTINVETVSATNSTTAGFELGPSVAGTAKITGGISQAAGDQATINQQIEQLTVYAAHDDLKVYRESERGIDLTGNTLLKIGLRQPDEKEIDFRVVATDVKLIDEKGKWRAPADANLTIASAKFVKPQQYCVHASLDYVLRHVVKGDATYTESDDTVVFVQQNVTDDFPLVQPRELEVLRWELRGGDGKSSLRVSNVQSGGGKVHPLYFTDRAAAEDMQRWIKAEGGPFIGAHQLVLSVQGDQNPQPLPQHARLTLAEVPLKDDTRTCKERWNARNQKRADGGEPAGLGDADDD